MFSETRKAYLACVALFSLNALICWPLFWAEYLNDFQSNEGTFAILAKFLLQSWPHYQWFPLFNTGVPFENAYFPLVPFLLAGMSWVARISPVHSLHFLAALEYSAAPVFLFLFAKKLSGRLIPSLSAAVLWSLISPSVLIPQVFKIMDTPWGSSRLTSIVFYGEIPHNLSLCLLPLALLLILRYLEACTPRRFAVAVLASAAVVLSNAFGAVILSISLVILLLARGEFRWRVWAGTGSILLVAYVLICRFLPPSLLLLLRANSETVGGDFRGSAKVAAVALAFLGVLAVLWAITRRVESTLRFAILFSAAFGGITLLWFWQQLYFVPNPHRYYLEMDAGVCVLAAFALYRPFQLLGRTGGRAVAGVAVVLLACLAITNIEFARRLIQPVNIAGTIAYRQARWIDTNLPQERVMIAGQNQSWFNLFAHNPQLSAGHEATDPNWMQRVAVYTIYTGNGAGDQDGPISAFWLRAFGCGAIAVVGAEAKDYSHPMVNPRKFDGLLPLVWKDGGDSVFRVPRRSTSLAHVIPLSAVVVRQPVHGLDIEPARAYVAALEDPALPLADIAWEQPGKGRISTVVGAGQVISVQAGYDPGWRATQNGKRLRVRRDQLGMLIIEPDGVGKCVIELRFSLGLERTICAVIGTMVGIGILVLLLRRAA